MDEPLLLAAVSIASVVVGWGLGEVSAAIRHRRQRNERWDEERQRAYARLEAAVNSLLLGAFYDSENEYGQAKRELIQAQSVVSLVGTVAVRNTLRPYGQDVLRYADKVRGIRTEPGSTVGDFGEVPSPVAFLLAARKDLGIPSD